MDVHLKTARAGQEGRNAVEGTEARKSEVSVAPRMDGTVADEPESDGKPF